MTRITLVAALLTTTAVVTVVTVPFVRSTLLAGAQDAFNDKGTQDSHEKPRPTPQQINPSGDLEDALYEILKRDREFNDPRWTFAIKVRDVQDKTLIDATFRHRTKGKENEYDAIIQAKRVVLRVDMDAKIVRAFLEQFEAQKSVFNQNLILIENNVVNIPIPLNAEQSLADMAGPSPAYRMVRPGYRMVRMDSDQALSLVYSSDGKTLATAGFDGVVHLWDIIKANKIAELKGEKSSIRSVTFAPDGKTVACVNDAGFVRLWDVATGKLNKTFPGLSEAMRQAASTLMLDSIAFAPDGHLLAVSGFGPTEANWTDRFYELSVFDVAGQRIWSHMGRGEQACSLAFAPDGATLARAGWRTVKLWDSKTGEPVRTLTPTKGTIFAIVFTPDGRTLVGGGNIPTKDVNHQAGLVTLWDLTTGQIIHTLKGHTGGVHAVAVAPDGKMVASGGDSHGRLSGSGSPSEIRLWDIPTGQLMRTVEGEQGTIRGLAFAPDGKTLVYCDDSAVGVVDVHTGRIERSLTKTNLTPQR